MPAADQSVGCHLLKADVALFLLGWSRLLSPEALLLLYLDVSLLQILAEFIVFLINRSFERERYYGCKEQALFHQESPKSTFGYRSSLTETSPPLIETLGLISFS